MISNLKNEFLEQIEVELTKPTFNRMKGCMNVFYLYLRDKPKDLVGAKFKIEGTSKASHYSYKKFFGLWHKFLEKKELFPTEESVPVIKEKKPTITTTYHSQAKICRTPSFRNHIKDKVEIDVENIKVDEEYKELVSDKDIKVIDNFIQEIFRDSFHFYKGSTYKKEEIANYYYCQAMNAVLVVTEDNQRVITIYESYLDPKEAKRRTDRILSQKSQVEEKYGKEVNSLEKKLSELEPILATYRDKVRDTEEEIEFSRNMLKLYKEREEGLLDATRKQTMAIINSQCYK